MKTTPRAAKTVRATATGTLAASAVRSRTIRYTVSAARPAASANSSRTAQTSVAGMTLSSFSLVTRAPYRQFRNGLPGTVPRMRALLVVNPKATTTSERSRDVLVRALRSQVDLTVEYTRRRGHATALIRAAAESGVDVVVTLGGDGTVNEAVNGLMTAESALADGT